MGGGGGGGGSLPICTQHVYVMYPLKSEKGVGTLGIGATDGDKPQPRFWELKPLVLSKSNKLSF